MLYGNKTGTLLKDKKDKSFITNYLSFYLVPLDVLFSNQFLEDLNKIWELHELIPDPSNPRVVIDK